MSAHQISSEAVGFRLSPQQDRPLTADRTAALQTAIALAGPIDEGRLRRAIEDTLARHEILRTAFPKAAGMRDRTQVIDDVPALVWRCDGNPGRAESLLGDPSALEALLDADREDGFELERAPLLRAPLVSPAAERALLVLSVHGACADVASVQRLAGDIVLAYAGEQQLTEPVQYADYAEWRHELITGDDAQAAEGRHFWDSQAEARPQAPQVLFATGPGGARQLHRVAISFSDNELASLRAAGSAPGVAGFLEACWHALIARITGVQELMLAGWCDGRTQPDLVEAIGPYAQPVPVRTRYATETTFAEVLDQVGRSRGTASAWQDFAGASDLGAVTAAAAAAFLSVNVQPLPAPALAAPRLSPGAAGTGLLLTCRIGSADLHVELWYDREVVLARDATTLARALRELALAAVADPSLPVSELPLLDAEVHQQRLSAGAGPAPEPDADIAVHLRFEAVAAATPGAVAVAGAGREVTYGELNVAANHLAHALRATGVTAGTTVGLCLDRTPALIEGLLGILKAGGAYVPLNPEHPRARIAHQLQESRAVALVTESGLLARLPAFEAETICLDRDGERLQNLPDENPHPLGSLGDRAYVMYTSGSTGLPKGVAVSHGNLANYTAHMARRLGGGEGVRFGVVSAISTDLGNTCIFPALATGGCVQLIGTAAAMDGDALLAELAGLRLDVLKITPSHLRALLGGAAPRDVLPRRQLVFGGEALAWELVARVRDLDPELSLINHYGPTETTIGCCACDVAERRPDSATVPIGRPMPGVRAYVLDSSGAPALAGMPGELCIAGAGVSLGYVGERSDDAAFGPEPTGSGRMYRTGDRARFLADGMIEFLGRVDDQVKIRGYRIEPGEIETALAHHPAVRQAAVVAEADEHGEQRLVAYIATTADPSVEELQAFLTESLPDYMIPRGFASLASLPFTPSGKVDRRALAGAAAMETRREAQFVGPRDEVEGQIALIWGELLGTERVGVHDDFFALGGHSLLATQAIMRIRRIYGDLPLRALLAAPTVAALADIVRAAAATP